MRAPFTPFPFPSSLSLCSVIEVPLVNFHRWQKWGHREREAGGWSGLRRSKPRRGHCVSAELVRLGIDRPVCVSWSGRACLCASSMLERCYSPKNADLAAHANLNGRGQEGGRGRGHVRVHGAKTAAGGGEQLPWECGMRATSGRRPTNRATGGTDEANGYNGGECVSGDGGTFPVTNRNRQKEGRKRGGRGGEGGGAAMAMKVEMRMWTR